MNMDDFGGFIPLINIDRRMRFEKQSYSLLGNYFHISNIGITSLALGHSNVL
jgi:hypothetical protein